MIKNNFALCIDKNGSRNALGSKCRLDLAMVVEVRPGIVHLEQVFLGCPRVIPYVHRYNGQLRWVECYLYKALASTLENTLRKIVAEGWNESRRKDREFMALPGQEYAR